MLHRIIEVVDNHPKLTSKKLNLCRSKLNSDMDSYPSDLPTFDDLKKFGNLKPGHSYVCLVPVKLLYGDSEYNRTDELNLQKAIDNLEEVGGFWYGHANILVAYMRPDGTLVLTQGNHRTAQRYLTKGPDALVVVNIKVHNTNDLKEIAEIEASNFHSDNMLRWNMIQEHKFKGGFVSGKKEYVELYNFVKPFGVSIAGTNVGDYIATHTFESYGNLSEALVIDDTVNKEYVKMAMSSLVKHLQEPDIKGFLFAGLVLFQKVFGERIYKIQKNNKNKLSFDDFIKYIFRERRNFNGLGNLTTQQDIVEDSGGIKIREFFASRFVVLFNEYCYARNIDWRVNGLKGACAIPESCEEWQNLIENVSNVKRRLFSATQF